MIDPLNDDRELECPSCNTDDPAERRNGCEDTWHDIPIEVTA